jgi:hypothetical protein
MSRIMTLGGLETPDASRSLDQLKRKAERLETSGTPIPPPDGTADAIQMALSELIKLDRYERRAARRRARALHILLDRKYRGNFRLLRSKRSQFYCVGTDGLPNGLR